MKRILFALAQRGHDRSGLLPQNRNEICDVAQMAEPETWHSVDQVMRRWPCTISVFIAHHLRCVGCAVGRHHTVEEACQAHAVDLEVFMEDLRHAVGQGWCSLNLGPSLNRRVFCLLR